MSQALARDESGPTESGCKHWRASCRTFGGDHQILHGIALYHHQGPAPCPEAFRPGLGAGRCSRAGSIAADPGWRSWNAASFWRPTPGSSPTSGSWDVASNWSNGVSRRTDDVVIDGRGSPTVTISSNVESVHSITHCGSAGHLRRRPDGRGQFDDQRRVDDDGRIAEGRRVLRFRSRSPVRPPYPVRACMPKVERL